MGMAGEEQYLMRRGVPSACGQIPQGHGRAFGPDRIKIDQDVVHNHRQRGGMCRMIADIGKPQRQIYLFLRASAQRFRCEASP